MSQGEMLAILQDAIYTVIKSAAPMLIVAMLVGLIVSVFQATTQINEQTLAFVPKIVCILLSIIIFGGYIINNVIDFTRRLFEAAGNVM